MLLVMVGDFSSLALYQAIGLKLLRVTTTFNCDCWPLLQKTCWLTTATLLVAMLSAILLWYLQMGGGPKGLGGGSYNKVVVPLRMRNRDWARIEGRLRSTVTEAKRVLNFPGSCVKKRDLDFKQHNGSGLLLLERVQQPGGECYSRVGS